MNTGECPPACPLYKYLVICNRFEEETEMNVIYPLYVEIGESLTNHLRHTRLHQQEVCMTVNPDIIEHILNARHELNIEISHYKIHTFNYGVIVVLEILPRAYQRLLALSHPVCIIPDFVDTLYCKIIPNSKQPSIT